MACYCCVLGCKNNNHKATTKHFFRFPKNDEKRRKLWKKFARKSIKATAVICEDHFETRFMIQKDKFKLTSDAIPTIFSKTTEEGLEMRVKIEFDGEDYYGDEAEEMMKEIAKAEDQEIVALETAFINEQVKLDELRRSCRFCAEIKDELIDISSFATYSINLNDFLQSLRLQIRASDFLPNSVCEECFNQVVVINTFTIKCKTADQWLWNEVEKLKTFNAAIASPIKSFETSQEEHVIEAERECYNGNETNYTDNIAETYAEEALEDEVADEDQNQMFTESYESAENCELSSTVEDLTNRTRRSGTKVTITPFMDPNCNRFAMRTYNCEICCKTFAGLKTYKSHVCDVPEIRCSDCGDIFETVFALKSHLRHLHSGSQQKNYCPICKTVIIGKTTVFKKHKTKCNRNRAEEIQCEKCSKVRKNNFIEKKIFLIIFLSQTFSSLHGYTVHQMFHDSSKKCEKDVFISKSSKTEKKKPEVICELCGKTYTTIG